MRSRGEPLLTTLKVVPAFFLKNAKTDPKIACFWAVWNILEGQDFYTVSKIHY